jgi:sulfite exporter TauE/SafE
MDSINIMAIVSVAFLGSLGHCIGMCGGFVVAYTSAKVDTTWGKPHQSIAHLLYNLGRVTSYIFIGMIFGYIGSIFIFSKELMGSFYIVIGILMILMGLSLMGKIRFLTSIESSIGTSNFFKESFSKLIRSKSIGSFYLLGMLNGFLPCGLVYFFAASAAATASPFWGAITMGVFGLMTIPSLLAFGILVGFLKNISFREIMIKLASFVIIGFGLYMIYKGYWFITDPLASIHTCH